MYKEFLKYDNDNIVISHSGNYEDDFNNEFVFEKLNYEDEREATLDFTIYEPTISELKEYDYKELNKKFAHQKRIYLDDFDYDENKNYVKKEKPKVKNKEPEIVVTKTSKPINVPLKLLLFMLRVILLFILCVLIFSVSRYNYLQEKNGDNIITFESFMDNVKNSTIEIEE